MDSVRVLLVEDDRRISERLVPALREQGFAVELLVDGHAAVERVLSGAFDVVLLDLNLPGRSGFEVLAAVQHRRAPPILVLTARTDLPTRVEAFRLGAADYVPKPFYTDEVVARIRARTGVMPVESQRVTPFADVVLHHDQLEARRGEASLGLTPHEATLLRFLVEREGRPFTRRQLIEAALPWESGASDRTVDAHVARLRKKLGSQAAKHIRTVFRVGYRFDRTLR